jgi:hypothetical protein
MVTCRQLVRYCQWRLAIEHDMLDSTLAERIPADQNDDYDQIFEQLREAATHKLDTEVQQELARLIAVIRRCKNIHDKKDEMDKSDKCASKQGMKQKRTQPVHELTIAMNDLLSKPPIFELAAGAICTAEIQNMRCQGGIPKWLVENRKHHLSWPQILVCYALSYCGPPCRLCSIT